MLLQMVHTCIYMYAYTCMHMACVQLINKLIMTWIEIGDTMQAHFSNNLHNYYETSIGIINFVLIINFYTY